jgi:hypothetical protein
MEVARGNHMDRSLNYRTVGISVGRSMRRRGIWKLLGSIRVWRGVVREFFRLIPLQNRADVNAYHTRSIFQPPELGANPHHKLWSLG